MMNFLKKYLGDPDVIEHLDFARATPHEFDLDGQKLAFLSPDYSCEILQSGASRLIKLGEPFWQTANSTIGPYQHLFDSSWNIYNQQLFNKERRGGLRLSIKLRHRLKLSNFHDLYQHSSVVISEYGKLINGGMINRQENKWTHEVTYSQSESEFLLLNNNGINWLCGYKLSEGFIENSFYHTLLNENVIIELRFSRRIGGGNTTHEMQPDIIDALNAAERDFIKHFKLEPKDNTLVIQNMLAEQYQGKVLTLDDIGKPAETTLLKAE